MVKIADYCIRCGLCIDVCPKNVIEVGTKINAKGFPAVVMGEGKECIGCAMCAQMCPEAAIEVWR